MRVGGTPHCGSQLAVRCTLPSSVACCIFARDHRRLERGHNVLAAVRLEATRLFGSTASCNWTTAEVPGVGHHAKLMLRSAELQQELRAAVSALHALPPTPVDFGSPLHNKRL